MNILLFGKGGQVGWELQRNLSVLGQLTALDFHSAEHCGNFAKTMLRLAQERERLTVIDDQWGAPTGADLLADVTAHAIRHLQARPQDAGLYHLAGSGKTNWHFYAKYVLSQAQQAQPAIKIKSTEEAPELTSAFPAPATRPHNSRLNTHKLQATFGLTLPHRQQGVARMLTEIL